MSVFFAGVGSRRTPPDVLALCSAFAAFAAGRGFVLRSGGAPGADAAFEAGAGAACVSFRPWSGFGGPCDGSVVVAPQPWTLPVAAAAHPAWASCSRGARALHARNVHQVLGLEGQAHSAFVLCWTPDGAVEQTSRATGGTGQAIRVALAHGVPVFNLARPEHRARVEAVL